MHFSSRTAWNTEESDLARALRQRRLAGLPVYDLTASNPTHCGFAYDPQALLAPLATPQALDYEADPRGLPSARQAVCGYYRDHGAALDPQQLFLTTSTSEAYSFLFRLLANPGDQVLIAQPSYPLFDFLAVLDDVTLVPYPLFHDHGWHLDPSSLRERITPRTRAIALVHPNNPTGHFLKPSERAELEAICREHSLALIVDEVFLDYPLEAAPQPSFATGPHPVLTFVLSGISKIAALPQMKAAWIAVFGPQSHEACDRLEVIADTFLSMNAPVQHALPHWLAGRAALQQQIAARTRANLAALDQLLAAQTLLTRLPSEAGWYATLRIPALGSGEETALAMLQAHGVYVHPGSFFGFRGEGWLVLSLLTPTQEFEQGISAILRYYR
ncbi:pyridoxal phosphate-dependent aminotransferase [Acidipila rosea]|uniref:alanine transaminase n=1 Tax=Acidipila rosea TaxID=768535 RepID=A0A4R1LCR3_9BACT|nr:pyridoxal phosphate-dependent aminotransferase [Acidipila rosea]TCK75974.1 aspartate/methionine/tyrosine aminotransferase [Acidipila rosea]